MVYYKQCILEKALGKWMQRQTAWIPETLAHVGQAVKFHVQRDLWDDGWVVTEVGTRMEEEYLLDHERDHLHQAKASDMVRDTDGRWKKL